MTCGTVVAAIPLSPFCDEPVEAGLVRFCFAKVNRTLEAATAKLRAVLAVLTGKSDKEASYEVQ